MISASRAAVQSKFGWVEALDSSMTSVLPCISSSTAMQTAASASWYAESRSSSEPYSGRAALVIHLRVTAAPGPIVVRREIAPASGQICKAYVSGMARSPKSQTLRPDPWTLKLPLVSWEGRKEWKKMEITIILGYIGATIRIRSFIPTKGK